jgi:hypothetical protein
MAQFRGQEKKRLVALKSRLFSKEACLPGLYRKSRRDFTLGVGYASENLWSGVRLQALPYFGERGISWHDGLDEPFDGRTQPGPSNHLCCSQSSCVNAWFPFLQEPERLREVLRGIGYDAVEMLPISSDRPLPDGQLPFVGFEWIGVRNYLREGPGGRPTRDEARTRGKNSTSADMVVRFRDGRGRIHVVLGEWKYTEQYANGESKRLSKGGTNRLATYAPHLMAPGCHIALADGVRLEDLFYDPFDQLMRLQLLASAMEREHEMDADVVSTLHMAPAANVVLMQRITSPGLRRLSGDIHGVWGSLVSQDRFRGVQTELLLARMLENAPDAQWRDYMTLRYLGKDATVAKHVP